MMQTNKDIHEAFEEKIDAYLTRELSDADTEDFQSHAAACPDCAAKLAEAQNADAAMRSYFAPLLPDSGFEDRLIAGLRKPMVIRRVHPWVLRAASSVAAAIALGAVGYYGGQHFNPRPHDRLSQGQLAALSPSLHDHAATTQPQDQTVLQQDLRRGDLATSVGLTEGAEVPIQRSVNGTVTFGAISPSSSVPGSLGQRGSEDFAEFGDKNGSDRAGFSFFYTSLGAGVDTRKVVDVPTNGPDNSKALAQNQHLYFDNQKLPMGWQDAAKSVNRGGTAVDSPVDPNSGKWKGFAAGRPVSGGVLALDNSNKPNELPELASAPTSSAQERGGQDEKNADTGLQPAAEHARAPVELSTVVGAQVDGGSAQHKLAAANPVAHDEARNLSRSQVEDSDKDVTEQVATSGDLTTSSPAPSYVDAGPSSTRPSTITAAEAARKIIRTGTMEFEVDSFDSALMRITKIAAEESGFVAATDSEKLENGKVKGTVTLRCPPEHLDTLVLKLRGLGDLKTQRITAQDVTKQFTDYESQLRAARAMEDRLLEIIKTGKGTVKDLVEAEKQLGVYRQQIEQIEGELRYMSSQVALSTLSVSLMERDIRTPFAAVESEQINAGIEAEDVEHARAEALKLIDDAKGRVIESELKKLDAGQLAATLVAEVSPESAGPLGDRLKQLGHVARWEATRKQTTEGGNAPTAQLQPNVKLQKKPTQIALSIYNLANVAPRQVTALTLVADDVGAAYRALVAAVNGNGKGAAIGRIVSGNLSAQKPEQMTGSITVEVKAEDVAAMEAALRSAGSVLHLSVTQNPDQNGVTDAKRGYGISIVASADVPAREQQTITVAANDVGATYSKLLSVLRDAKTAARIVNSQLSEPEEDNIVGTVDLEIPTSSRPAVDAVLSDGKQDDVISRNVVRSADTENTLADKLHLTVSIGSAERLPPRETTRLTLQASDVGKALDAAAAAGGSDARVTERNLNQQPDGQASGHVVIDVPLSAAQTTLDQLRSLGKVASAESFRDARVTAGPMARARFEVVVENAQTLVSPQEGIGASIQRGLRTALNGLLWSVQMVVVGLVLIGPFALVIWTIVRLARRKKTAEASG